MTRRIRERFAFATTKFSRMRRKSGHVDPQGGAGLGDKVVLILTDFGKLNGKVLLEKTKMHPPVWVGTLRAEDGTEWHFKAKLATTK